MIDFRIRVRIIIQGFSTQVRGPKLDPISNRSRNCLFSLTISPNIESFCGEMCGQMYIYDRTFCTNMLIIRDIVSENKQLRDLLLTGSTLHPRS